VKDRVYGSVIRTALGLFRVLDFQFNVLGVENLPDSGGAVLASNHVSYFDFMFIGLATREKGRLVRFMAKKSVFDNPVAGPLMRGMHHIPVDRAAGSGAYQEACNALRAGEFVGVFPESTISRAFVPRTFKSGAARMAVEADVPLVPMIVWGGHRVWTSGRKPVFVRHVPVTIQIGAPLEFSATDDPADVTALLHERMTTMAEGAQRAYPAPETPDEQWWQPAYLGGGAPTLEAAGPIEAAAIEARRERKLKKKRRWSRG
jgi:1-acyl-sn-glycerol-3-phosphate acyltransferase